LSVSSKVAGTAPTPNDLGDVAEVLAYRAFRRKDFLFMKIVSGSFILIAAGCFSSLVARAQGQTSVGTERPANVTASNAIYLEMLGPGLLYSINYERRLTNSVALRVGFSSWSLSIFSTTSATIIPMTLSWFPFSDRESDPSSKLEIGAGMCYFNAVLTHDSFFFFGPATTKTSSGVFFTGIFGYRYQASDGGFMFRAAFTPIYTQGETNNSIFDAGFTPYGSVAFGYGF
jgi:hypothetical protein